MKMDSDPENYLSYLGFFRDQLDDCKTFEEKIAYADLMMKKSEGELNVTGKYALGAVLVDEACQCIKIKDLENADVLVRLAFENRNKNERQFLLAQTVDFLALAWFSENKMEKLSSLKQLQIEMAKDSFLSNYMFQVLAHPEKIKRPDQGFGSKPEL